VVKNNLSLTCLEENLFVSANLFIERIGMEVLAGLRSHIHYVNFTGSFQKLVLCTAVQLV